MINRFAAAAGFTLIEILTVLAIALLLVGIGYPSYLSMIANKRQLQGESLLHSLRQKQVQYFGLNLVYTDDLRLLDYSDQQSSLENKVFYQARAQTCAGQSLQACVVLVATPLFEGDPYLWTTNSTDRITTSTNPP